jgi:hypothetical protein
MNNALIKMLEEEREQLLLKLKAVDHAIDAYTNSFKVFEGKLLFEQTPGNDFQESVQALVKKYHHYNPAVPTRTKILFILKAENRFLHVREISRIVQQLEDEVSVTAVIKKISPALSILKRLPDSPLVSIEVAHSHFNTFWGLNTWLSEDGSIKPDFMYNADQITRSQKESIFAGVALE